MGRWTMTNEELRHATRATKEAARAWADPAVLDEPSAPEVPAPRAVQQHAPPKEAVPKPPRETVFDITDSSTISSVDSLQQMREFQHQQQLFQQQIKRAQAKQYQSPIIPSPVSSPSPSSLPSEMEMTTPHTPQSPSFGRRPPQQPPRAKVALNLRSDFSLSDSDESSDEDDEMKFAGRSQNYASKHQQQPHSQQQRFSPNPNVVVKPQQQHHEHPPRTKTTPPPLTAHSPHTLARRYTRDRATH